MSAEKKPKAPRKRKLKEDDFTVTTQTGTTQNSPVVTTTVQAPTPNQAIQQAMQSNSQMGRAAAISVNRVIPGTRQPLPNSQPQTNQTRPAAQQMVGDPSTMTERIENFTQRTKLPFVLGYPRHYDIDAKRAGVTMRDEKHSTIYVECKTRQEVKKLLKVMKESDDPAVQSFLKGIIRG